MSLSAIEYQTNSIQSKIPKLNDQSNTYKEKSKYQMEMYESIKFVNQVLLAFYIILFSGIHILLLSQYIQGIKRDATTDTIWLFVLFFYPYLIYYIESVIYFVITYLLSLVYGQTYVYQFDKMFLFTDFYSVPSTKDK
jgi:TM2 domain-containing membrane protein YozV